MKAMKEEIFMIGKIKHGSLLIDQEDENLLMQKNQPPTTHA
jgi:hypothetical protein